MRWERWKRRWGVVCVLHLLNYGGVLHLLDDGGVLHLLDDGGCASPFR